MFKKISFLGVISLFLVGAGCINFGSTATGPMGVFRSKDRGETWQQANTFPTSQGVKSLSSARVFKVFTDPNDPNALYMGTRGQGLYYTFNNGDSWQSAGMMMLKQGDSWQQVDVFANKYIYALAVDPGDKCTVYVSDGGSIYKTSDCSRTWKSVYSEQRDQRITSMTVDYGNRSIVYATLFSGQILQSTNAGVSWKVIKDFNSPLQYIIADPLTPSRVYVASVSNGLARSDDNGATWLSLSQGLMNYADSFTFYRLVLHPTQKNTVFWISKYGILHSENAGKDWTDFKLLSPPGSVNIYSFGVNPGNPKELYYVGTILGENSSRSTFYKSTDGGNNWVTKKLPTNTIPVNLVIHPTDNNTLFMGFTVPDKQ